MYLKVKRPDGDWELHESKSIIFSECPCAINPQEGEDADDYWDPRIPPTYKEVISSHCASSQILILNFKENIHWDWKTKSWKENTYKTKTRFTKVESVESDYVPELWEGRLPLYNYAIFPEEHKAIVFPTVAYIINDDGKTINKIGY